MEKMGPELKRFLQTWLVNTLAVLVAVYILNGLHFQEGSFWIPFVTSLVLGILNAFIRPIVMLLALPLLLVTLGLFMLVINAMMLFFVGYILRPHFVVESFWDAFWGAVIISIVTMALNALTGNTRARIKVQRGGRKPNPPRPPPPGSGSVIDV